jgi:A/G-specific adenine glycosylase
VKAPKRPRREEKLTVLILRADDRYALEKRSSTGLLADLLQFPNVQGWLEIPQVLDKVEELGLKPKEIKRQVEKEHIFTHIKWRMRGVYLDVKETNERYTWLTAQEVETMAALPTAFRQFWDIGEDNNGK